MDKLNNLCFQIPQIITDLMPLVLCVFLLVFIVFSILILVRLKRNAKIATDKVDPHKPYYRQTPPPVNNCVINITPAGISIESGEVQRALQQPVQNVSVVEQAEKEERAEEVIETPATETPAKKEEVAATTEDDNGGVVFSNEKKTLQELYKSLSREQKKYFDGLKKYALKKEGTKLVSSTGHETVKFGKEKLLRLTIKKDLVNAIFVLTDPSFKKVLSGDASVKETPITIKIDSSTSYDSAISTIDLKYDSLVAEKNQKLEEKKAKRREKKNNK